MNWFKSKEKVEPIKEDTRYIVYYNRPHENNNGSFYMYQSSNGAQEYATLEEAQKAAKGLAQYFKVYITCVNCIYKYYNDIVEVKV